jgi:RelA/SpoT family (p)ppGpp synthetase
LDFDKLKDIRTIEEATATLWQQFPNPSPQTKFALKFALDAHKNQKRKSGEDYIVHPILVATITASISNDEIMVQAALLHDVIEDTRYELVDILQNFGKEVAYLVEGLTKIVEIRDEELISSTSNEKLISSALTFRKMLIVSIKDVRVLVIKLCDRLHNMLTLDALRVDKQKRISEETLVVYAPIAHRLGISKLKNKLEDLSFYYIYPDDYKKIDDYITKNVQSLQIKLNSFIQRVSTLIVQDGFDIDEFEIFGRVKHYYSIYLKMHRKGVSIEEVLDLLAIRIIVKEPTECYRVLGVMHLNFTPLISRFKDYIAVPKENGYKTIHTTLFDKDSIIEAQIRTEQMHRLAEYGVAAHWKYKDGSNGVNLDWLESLHYQSESVEEFYELAKSDLFSEDITVFSPKGDYYTLPKDSTALDFAYAVHSQVGKNAVDALINKRRASLLSTLKNGDIVKIIKDDKEHLYCSWLDAVKTSKARNGIKSMCKARLKENDTYSAYNMLSTLFDINYQKIEEIVVALNLAESIHKLPNQIDFYKDSIHKVAEFIGAKEVRFWEFLKKGYKRPFAKNIELFTIYGNKVVDSIEFDYCCHPKAGDKIVAFYKDSKVIIHHKLCSKAYEMIKSHHPMIWIDWRLERLSKYRLIVSLQNKKGELAKLLSKLSDLDLNILSIELGIQSSESAEYCQIEVESPYSDRNELEVKLSNTIKLIELTNLDDAYNK